MVRAERFELPTPCFVGKCSIQLSYARNGNPLIGCHTQAATGRATVSRRKDLGLSRLFGIGLCRYQISRVGLVSSFSASTSEPLARCGGGQDRSKQGKRAHQIKPGIATAGNAFSSSGNGFNEWTPGGSIAPRRIGETNKKKQQNRVRNAVVAEFSQAVRRRTAMKGTRHSEEQIAKTESSPS